MSSVPAPLNMMSPMRGPFVMAPYPMFHSTPSPAKGPFYEAHTPISLDASPLPMPPPMPISPQFSFFGVEIAMIPLKLIFNISTPMNSQQQQQQQQPQKPQQQQQRKSSPQRQVKSKANINPMDMINVNDDVSPVNAFRHGNFNLNELYQKT